MASYHQHLFLLNSSDHTVFEELENLNETEQTTFLQEALQARNPLNTYQISRILDLINMWNRNWIITEDNNLPIVGMVCNTAIEVYPNYTHSQTITDTTPAHIRFAFTDLINKLQIAVQTAPKEQQILLLKSAIAARRLQLDPNNSFAIQEFDACYKQVAKFSLLLSVTHALLRFAAFFIKPLKPLSAAAKAHSEIGNKMQAFREALTKPIGFFNRHELESVAIYQNKAKTDKPKRQVMN